MRPGHQFGTPSQQSPYQHPGDHLGNPDVVFDDLPFEFLGGYDPNAGHPGAQQELGGLDRRLSKQLSLGSLTGESAPGSDVRYQRWPESEEDYAGRGYRPRHARSISLGVEHGFGPPGASDGRGRHQPRPSYGPQYGGPPGSGMGRGRLGGGSYPGRGPPQQAVQQGNGRGDGERGQGYRKLWQQVTKVGRGQKLGDNHEAVPFSDMTVEDLLRIVRNLPPEESAVQAVSRGLFYLDSRALAALLKELHKVGLSNRAAELFDWLRGLPEGHDLAHLCDVYTYTTIISQCGSHQQLRKALELVAEMRGKGIPCNVHTYSALMNVCIKANELELALDVYNQLLREGCTPNLVTYNILIDVHGKTGQWQDAVKVLDALESQGTKPEVRTYNTIINACNRSGQPEYALKVYERMLADGAQPTATTYTALISAYGKTGKVEEALQIFQDMVARNCERNVITYSSLISACEKAGRWQLALELFDEMHRDSCKPNVVTFNALIAACGQVGQWKAASDVFDGMASNGCKPDSVTYGTLISAFDKGGQWTRALQAFDKMQSQGHRPDAGVYNVVVEVLGRSGTLPASLKAIQLFLAASRQGQLRMMSQGTADTTVIAFTVGAANLALLQWLQDLSAKATGKTASPSSTVTPWSSPSSAAATTMSSGVTSPSGPGSPPAQPTPERATLLLLKGKHGRSESPPASIEESVSALLVAANVPHAVTLTPQGVRIEVEIGGNATKWAEGTQLKEVLSPLGVAPSRKLPTDVLVSEDLSAEARCSKAFAAVQEFEEAHPLGGKASSEEDTAARRESVGLLVQLGRTLGLLEETVHDSVQLLDQLARRGLSPRNAASPVVLAAIALIAAHQGERAERLPSDSAVEAAAGVSSAAVAEMQENLRAVMQSDTGAISALRILHLYLERLSCEFQDPTAMARMAGEAQQLMSEAIFQPGLVEIAPSLVAAAVLVVARRTAGSWPYWPHALAQLTGYQDPGTGAFAAATEAAAALVSQPAVPAHLQLVASPLPPPPPATLGLSSSSMGLSSPPSGGSLASLPSLGSLLSPSLHRTTSATAPIGPPQGSLSPQLPRLRGMGGELGRSGSLTSVGVMGGDGVSGLPRAPSLPGVARTTSFPVTGPI